VGSDSTEIYNPPASWNLASAAEVFAICISEIVDSCIRAPPEQETITSGKFSFVARSTARVI
jgi:hypothetical protein